MQQETQAAKCRYSFYILVGIMFMMNAVLVFFSHGSLENHLPFFLVWAFLLQLLVLITFLYVQSNHINVSTQMVLFMAVCVHLIGIMGKPIFEDDYFRYLWDAYVFYTQGSPYGVSPESFFSDTTVPEKFQETLSYINHPALPTIYGPTLQYAFLSAFLIDPANVWVLQCLFAIANLAIIRMLLKLAQPKYLILYIFSPLIFKEILMTAHPDGFAVAFLVAALLAHKKGYGFITGVLLGASIAAKIFAILFIPFLILRHPRKVFLGLLSILFVVYGPFLQGGASDLAGLFHMANDWEFNSALWGLSRAFFSLETTRLLMALILMAVLGGYWVVFYLKQKHNSLALPRGDIILGAFLICAPVINPWYIVWVLPFAVVWPSVTAWFASGIVLLSYLVPIYLPSLQLAGNYDQPIVIRWLEFSLLGLVFLGELLWRYKKVKIASGHIGIAPP